LLIKPSSSDFPEYYRKYTDTLPNTGILQIYEQQTNEVLKLYNSVSKEMFLFKYAPSKWTILEVLGHLIDSEIIMGYRALTYARKDKSNLPLYDHDNYVIQGKFNNLNSDLLIEHYATVRKSNLLLFKTFTEKNWNAKGVTGDKDFIASSIPYILVGHTKHHVNVIKEKYLWN